MFIFQSVVDWYIIGRCELQSALVNLLVARRPKSKRIAMNMVTVVQTGPVRPHLTELCQ